MIRFIRNIFVIPELRKRVIFTLLLLAVYRMGSQIVTPGLNSEALQQFFDALKGTFFGFMDMFSGKNISRMTIFALGVMPYISASIILQLLQVVWPYLDRIAKEGELGKKKITQYTRYGTVLICLIQGGGIAIGLERMNPNGIPVVLNPGWGFRMLTILTLTTGTMFIMWLGEQISERGIGNGISLIIFAGIVVGLVPGVGNTMEGLKTGDMSPLKLIFILAMIVLVIAFICYVEMGQRRIPITYAKRIQGRKMMGGQSTFLPLKVNTGGVIPIIFASSVITFPATILQFIKHPIAQKITAAAHLGHAALQPALHHLDHLFHLFLYFHHFQPAGRLQQPAEIRRLHPRHPRRQKHRRLYRRRAFQADLHRRHLPGAGRPAAGIPDDRLQGRGPAFCRRFPGGQPAALVL